MSDAWFREALRAQIFERELARRSAAGVPSLLAHVFELHRGDWDELTLRLGLDLTRMATRQSARHLFEFVGPLRKDTPLALAETLVSQAHDTFNVLLRGTTVERFLGALRGFMEPAKPHSFEREAAGHLAETMFDLACGREPAIDLGSVFRQFVQRHPQSVIAAFEGKATTTRA
ncbi:MAG TPA: hypothetical protein VM074_09805 [Solimonas sp.]|nr:hypothetical protein [Solimonas sp.]